MPTKRGRHVAAIDSSGAFRSCGGITFRTLFGASPVSFDELT